MLDGDEVDNLSVYPAEMWARYTKAGFGGASLWAESAFKGGGDPMADVPSVETSVRYKPAVACICSCSFMCGYA